MKKQDTKEYHENLLSNGMKMNKIKLSKSYAYVKLPFHIVILNNKKKGFQCSKKAKENLQNSSPDIRNEVYAIKMNEKIIWVSTKEFIENKFNEFSIPNEWIITEQKSI
jgi:hypothetical protein